VSGYFDLLRPEEATRARFRFCGRECDPKVVRQRRVSERPFRQEGADLDEVLGEDAVSGAGACYFGAVDADVVPAVTAFAVADAVFAASRWCRSR
jgi:hypothetical protein